MVEFQTLGFLSGTVFLSFRPQNLAFNSTLVQISARTISTIAPSYVIRDLRRNTSSSDEVVNGVDIGQTTSSSDLFARLSLILEKLSRPLFSYSSLDIGCKPIQQSPIAYNTLMKAFTQVGKLDEVLRLAREMKESNCNPNVYCYNTVMNALVEANQPAEAEALFKEMIADGVSPNVSSYNILVKLYSFCLKDFNAGHKVIAMMMENECFPDLTTHSTLITGLCRAGRVEEARDYLYWMLEEKCPVDAYTYTPIVQGYCTNRKIEEAKQLMDDMERLGYLPNSVTYNILVGALCKAGSFEDVEKVLRESSSKCWKPDEFTFNTYMDGLCKHGRVKYAYEKLEMMLKNDILPSKVTLNILLDCLCHEMRFSEAIYLLDRSSELEWHPGIVGYNTVMSRLCKNGRWSIVLKLLVDIIKKVLHCILKSLLSFSTAIVKPTDPTFQTTPWEISHDYRYMLYFKNCIGAIDGTHIDARVSNVEKVAFIGRCGYPTQNVMAVCDFNMCFTFVMAGWEGSAHDSRIFKIAIRDPQYNFPSPPPGKYYLVDAGYPMQRGFLKPFADTRYHIPDFERAGHTTRGRKEMFNKRHSSLRGVIERTFGVWKKKWVILRDMPTYSFNKQVRIVAATMALHNYIRRHHSQDDFEFNVADEDQSFVPPEAFEYRVGQSLLDTDQNTLNTDVQDGAGAEEMIELREMITNALVNE